MYKQTTYKKEGLEYIELFDSNGFSKVKISVDQGASVLNLKLDNAQVIDMDSSSYEDTYASSILFPFANRVKNGTYKHNNKTYQLDCNDMPRNNALHGLVYNKRIAVKTTELTADFGLVTLHYSNDGASIGFPFTYELLVTYKLKNNALTVTVKVENTDSSFFPFTLGWHPYFKSEDLYNSYLRFKSTKKLKFDNQLIPLDIEAYTQTEALQIKDSKLDDCYILSDNEVEFVTPTYNMKISTTSIDNFLQLYTPEKRNTIAIEPMTGVSDSLNNKIGLQILDVGKTYEVSWNIIIENLTKNMNTKGYNS
ncbi:MAG: aldose 1-epimerase [Kordia sp.]|uniref:aldose 1-epimerase n=1 Tax=Kordia sp. TaxID=1965332 RepID=UPI00385CC389